MLIGFSLVFTVVVGMVFLFFGMLWKHGDFMNLSIKMTALMLAFGSAYVAVNCSSLPVVYLVASGLASLFLAAVWESNSALNLVCKSFLSIIAITSAILVILP